MPFSLFTGGLSPSSSLSPNLRPDIFKLIHHYVVKTFVSKQTFGIRLKCPRASFFLSYAHTERQRQYQRQTSKVPLATWEWVWDRFWSGTMHSNGTLPLPLPLAARCAHTLRLPEWTLSNVIRVYLKTWFFVKTMLDS